MEFVSSCKKTIKRTAKNIVLLFFNVIITGFILIFKIQRGKVVYIPVDFSFRGNAKFLLNEWITVPGYQHIFLCGRNKIPLDSKDENVIFCPFGLLFIYHYSTAEYIIRESEFNSIGLMPRRESKVIQLWHAAGAFKKFCLDIADRPESLRRSRVNDIKNWDLVLCSSKELVDIYSSAFGNFDKKKIFVGGLPRNDYLYHVSSEKDLIRKRYDIPQDKKVIIYAPTFRDNETDYSLFLDFVIFLQERVGNKYIVAVRFHPKIADKIKIEGDILDLNSCDVEEALVVSDILITDYSSIIFDYALLDKPMLFYAPDLDDYYDSRGFYFDYRNFVPGPIAETKEDVLEQLENINAYSNIVAEFREKFNPYFDGKNSSRILGKILSM